MVMSHGFPNHQPYQMFLLGNVSWFPLMAVKRWGTPMKSQFLLVTFW
jgi:hypothetical protein